MDAFFEQSWVKFTLKYLPISLSFLLVIILGVLLAQLVWLWLTPEIPTVNAPIFNKVSTINQAAFKSPDYGKKIADLHLFGVADKKIAAKKTVIKKITPVTKLNLKLHGTFSYGNHAGFAVISAQGKSQKTYAKGDKIGGSSNTILTAIYPDYVLLDRNGKQERLQLPKSRQTSRVNRPAPVVSAPRPAAPMPTVMKTPSSPAADITLDTNNLEGLRQELLKNPSKLMNIARAEPITMGDKFLGFRLNPGKDRKTFDAMGFKAGDIVTAVNGAVIENPAQGFSIMQSLTTADAISVTVKRGKETITLDGVF